MTLCQSDPTNSVGPLTFGMDEVQVTEIVGTQFEQFWRTPESTELVHAYDRMGLHLTFESNDRLKQVTVVFRTSYCWGGFPSAPTSVRHPGSCSDGMGSTPRIWLPGELRARRASGPRENSAHSSSAPPSRRFL
jgi:hypothetical protein